MSGEHVAVCQLSPCPGSSGHDRPWPPEPPSWWTCRKATRWRCYQSNSGRNLIPTPPTKGARISSWIPIVCSALALVVAVGMNFSHLQLRREVDKLGPLGQTDTVVVPEVRDLRVDEAMRSLRSVGLRGAAETSQGEVSPKNPVRVYASRRGRSSVYGRGRSARDAVSARCMHRDRNGGRTSGKGPGHPRCGRGGPSRARKGLREEYRATDSHIQRVPGRCRLVRSARKPRPLRHRTHPRVATRLPGRFTSTPLERPQTRATNLPKARQRCAGVHYRLYIKSLWG